MIPMAQIVPASKPDMEEIAILGHVETMRKALVPWSKAVRANHQHHQRHKRTDRDVIVQSNSVINRQPPWVMRYSRQSHRHADWLLSHADSSFFPAFVLGFLSSDLFRKYIVDGYPSNTAEAFREIDHAYRLQFNQPAISTPEPNDPCYLFTPRLRLAGLLEQARKALSDPLDHVNNKELHRHLQDWDGKRISHWEIQMGRYWDETLKDVTLFWTRARFHLTAIQDAYWFVALRHSIAAMPAEMIQYIVKLGGCPHYSPHSIVINEKYVPYTSEAYIAVRDCENEDLKGSSMKHFFMKACGRKASSRMIGSVSVGACELDVSVRECTWKILMCGLLQNYSVYHTTWPDTCRFHVPFTQRSKLYLRHYMMVSSRYTSDWAWMQVILRQFQPLIHHCLRQYVIYRTLCCPNLVELHQSRFDFDMFQTVTHRIVFRHIQAILEQPLSVGWLFLLRDSYLVAPPSVNQAKVINHFAAVVKAESKAVVEDVNFPRARPTGFLRQLIAPRTQLHRTSFTHMVEQKRILLGSDFPLEPVYDNDPESESSRLGCSAAHYRCMREVMEHIPPDDTVPDIYFFAMMASLGCPRKSIKQLSEMRAVFRIGRVIKEHIDVFAKRFPYVYSLVYTWASLWQHHPHPMLYRLPFKFTESQLYAARLRAGFPRDSTQPLPQAVTGLMQCRCCHRVMDCVEKTDMFNVLGIDNGWTNSVVRLSRTVDKGPQPVFYCGDDKCRFDQTCKSQPLMHIPLLGYAYRRRKDQALLLLCVLPVHGKPFVFDEYSCAFVPFYGGYACAACTILLATVTKDLGDSVPQGMRVYYTSPADYIYTQIPKSVPPDITERKLRGSSSSTDTTRRKRAREADMFHSATLSQALEVCHDDDAEQQVQGKRGASTSVKTLARERAPRAEKRQHAKEYGNNAMRAVKNFYGRDSAGPFVEVWNINKNTDDDNDDDDALLSPIKCWSCGKAIVNGTKRCFYAAKFELYICSQHGFVPGLHRYLAQSRDELGDADSLTKDDVIEAIRVVSSISKDVRIQVDELHKFKRRRRS